MAGLADHSANSSNDRDAIAVDLRESALNSPFNSDAQGREPTKSSLLREVSWDASALNCLVYLIHALICYWSNSRPGTIQSIADFSADQAFR